MRPKSSAFDDAVLNGGTRVDRAYALPGNGSRIEVPLVSWRVTASRAAVARYSGTVVLSSDADAALVQPYGARIQIMSGFNTGTGEELVACATMRIDDVDTDESGQLGLTCFGLEKVVEENRFWTPQAIDASSALGEIRRLIQESLDVDVVVMTQSDALAPIALYERDRWPAIDGDDRSIARSLGVEVYADALGTFVVRDIPTLNDPAVWRVSSDTVLVTYSTQVTRNGVYNVVVASGDNVGQDQGVEVAFGMALDDNPLSSTYYKGPFGTVVRFYNSPLLVDSLQAYRAAKSLLSESMGLARSLSFTNVPNPALEPGDVVEVQLPGGTIERHIIDSIQFGSTGAQQCDTRAEKIVMPSLTPFVDVPPAGSVGTPQSTYITWAGHSWFVRDDTGGPGPNRFARYTENVWVGTNGYLNLAVKNIGGTWCCAEIQQADATLGYGRYRFVYDVPNAPGIDANLVFGMFTYDDTDPGVGKREIDVEVTKFGYAPETSSMFYTVQPSSTGEQVLSDHTMSSASPYTTDVYYQSGQVYWKTTDANGVLLGEHLANSGVQATGNQQVRFNLWLIGGAAPTDGLEKTVAVRSFTFTGAATHATVAAASYVNTFSSGYGLAIKPNGSIAASKLTLPCQSTYNVAYTGSILDVRNSTLWIEASSVPTGGAGTREATFALRYDANNYLMMFVSGGTLAGRVRQGGVNTATSIGAYSSTTHRWWRIGLSGTTVTFYTSLNGTTWTSRGTQTTTISSSMLAAMRLRLECGYFGTETGPPAFVIEGVNT